MWEIVREHRGIFSIPEMISKSAKEFRNYPALGWFDKKGKLFYLSYEEIWERAKWIAAGLKSLGIKPGQYCGILAPNSVNWGLSYLGVLTAQGICVPVDPQLKPFEIKHILKHAKTRFVFTISKFLDTIMEIQEEEGLFKKIILIDEVSVNSHKTVTTLHELLEKGKRQKGEFKFPEKHNVAVLIYTSGTTGRAKGVMLTHENIVSDIAAIYQIVELGPGDSFLSVLPIHHTFECTAGFLLPLYSGAKVAYARSLKSKYLMEDLKKAEVTVMLGVPLLYQKMWEAIERKLKRLPLAKRLIVNAFLKGVKIAGKLNKEMQTA